MSQLSDLSPMPFGEHKGKLMQDVPTRYLHFLWHAGMKTEDTPVANYIRENLHALQKENPDLIWDE